MKKLNPLLRYAAATAIGIVSSIGSASAVTLTFDADGTPPASDGGNLWDTATVDWYNGSTDQVWSNGLGDTAIFGAASTGTGGTVTVSTVNVGLIQFNPQTTTGYTLQSGIITLGTGITTTSAVNSVISSAIAGSNGLAFNGVLNAQNGLTLSGTNTYTGITTLSTGGRVSTTTATALGSSVGATASALGTNYTQINALTTVNVGTSTAEAFLINGQGSIASGNAPGALRIANGATLSSFVQLGSSALIGSNFGTVTLSGNVDLAANTLSFGNGNNPGTFTLSGVVTGTAGGLTLNNGSGSANVVNLTNAGNSFAGTTTVNAGGTLGLGGDTVLGTSTLAVAGGTVQSTNATARTIANVVTVSASSVFGATATQTGTLTFTNTTPISLGSTAKTFTTNVNTTFSAPFGGTTASVTKAGTATLTLGGASTFTGGVNVNAGTLLVNNTTGSGTGTGAVIVSNTGSTLGGTGAISGAVTVNTGAILTGGTTTTTGNLTTGLLTLTSGSIVSLQAASTSSNDLIISTGALNYGGGTLTIGSIGGFNIAAQNGTYNFLDFASIQNDLGSVSVDGTALTLAGSTWTGSSGTTNFSFTEADGILAVTAAVPEPTTWAALLTGLGAWSLRKRFARVAGKSGRRA